ncbi:RNA polymerase sigma-70 factor [Acidisarcina polymorpha]|uniref:RNA polymerase sigma-70 factor n=1 Tax=Acidisarcina polymorpha TaxID=2211140 RepID=A0A2Z5FVY3_9BACT|nr:RNA polymerase sigma factor [Acidisarcina polymorpha]AXC10900.1 RNA polymerase sigma-70 factor [Acidisarcina polymorpha]
MSGTLAEFVFLAAMSSSEGQIVGWMHVNPMVAAPADSLNEVDSGEAIAALVSQYSNTLYRVAYSITRNSAEAEDAVQETFLRVLRHREKLGEIRDHRVWLVRITWNVVLDRKRRTKTRPETEDIADLVRTLPANNPTSERTAISSQEHARILALIDQLPKKEREALLLSAVEELSTAQAAAVLNTSESSVRSRIFRARHQLAALLDKERIAR